MYNFKSIYKGHITLEDEENEQIELRKGLELRNLYNSREEVVQMFNDYAKNMSKNIYESKQGTGLKMLTPKQMLQILSIAIG